MRSRERGVPILQVLQHDSCCEFHWSERVVQSCSGDDDGDEMSSDRWPQALRRILVEPSDVQEAPFCAVAFRLGPSFRAQLALCMPWRCQSCSRVLHARKLSATDQDGLRTSQEDNSTLSCGTPLQYALLFSPRKSFVNIQPLLLRFAGARHNRTTTIFDWMRSAWYMLKTVHSLHLR